MICTLCHTFVGSPCAVCRTYSRIGYLIGVQRLGAEQEARALQVLRDCCGAVTDLVETKIRAAPPSAAANEGGNPLSEGKGPLTKEEEEDQEEEDQEEKTREDKKKPLSVKEEVKTEKDKKKRKKKTEAEAGVEETPEKSGSAKIKKTKEEHREGELGGGGASSGSRGPAVGEEAEELQERIDSFACSNPGPFELGTLPVRGSVGRHFAESEEDRRRSTRPAEPVGPPPGRHDERPRRQPSGERRGKKNKGQTHRDRGREWRRRHWS